MEEYKHTKLTCDICGSHFSVDEEFVEKCKWNINGLKVTLCTPCEDDLLKKLLSARISKERMEDIASPLMSDEKEDLLGLYGYEDSDEEQEE